MSKNFYERVAEIQRKVIAPKNQHNKFGNYKYRSCEDILEAVKDHLDGLVLTMNDSIEMIGNRYYVRSRAKISNGEDYIESCGFAREQEDKKGMDASQITGSSSSYARKYALNALFCIDDCQDADSMNTQQSSTPTPPQSATPTPTQQNANQSNSTPSDESAKIQKIKEQINDLFNGMSPTEKEHILKEATYENSTQYGEKWLTPKLDFNKGWPIKSSKQAYVFLKKCEDYLKNNPNYAEKVSNEDELVESLPEGFES